MFRRLSVFCGELSAIVVLIMIANIGLSFAQSGSLDLTNKPVMRVRAASPQIWVRRHPYYTSTYDAMNDGAFTIKAWTLVRIIQKAAEVPFNNAITMNDCARFNPQVTDQRSICSLLIVVINDDGSPRRTTDGKLMEGYVNAGQLEAWTLGQRSGAVTSGPSQETGCDRPRREHPENFNPQFQGIFQFGCR